MKVVVAIDSFKGSLSSVEAGDAARRGILKACDAQVIVKPLADGGEGTTEALGKVHVGVARLAKKYQNKVIAFAGGVTDDAGKCNEEGIDAFFPIIRGVTTLDEAMVPENARKKYGTGSGAGVPAAVTNYIAA